MASVRRLNAKDPKSPWICEYTDAAGKRRRETPKTGLKKDAEAIKRRVETELQSGQHVAISQTIGIRDAADLWLKSGEDKVRSGIIGECTWRGFRSIIDSSIIPRFGNRPIKDLTFTDVEAWHSDLLRRLKPVTAKNHLLALKQIEDFAGKRGFTKRNIVKQVLAEVRYGGKSQIKTFRMEQVQLLLRLVDELNITNQRKTTNVRGYFMLKAAVQLAAFCGLRMGEIWGLTVGCVDMERGVLKIRHSLTQLDQLKGPKTKAGNRDIPMPRRVQETVAEWCRRFYVTNERGLIFRMPGGSMVTPRNFRSNYWVPLLQRAGLHDAADTMHFHALRHFAASLMIELGLPLTDVASLLGHEKFDMTLQVYAHPIVGGNRRHEAFERIASALAAPAENDVDATMPPKLLISEARPIATA
ncbi:tyrosine-type recombinase/integrase [Hansschlegelia plantiphila]|uniref:Tyr recombinase domain-containing protein n=1 Tax=Hansschlegelia plantiphila TaxID=374655 RepID=A0A9W6IXK2_9HYPH|nr:site-specific integrase [Hansschlegelia plantiphila]GLK67020.1 hypothetical protein GCM10008179_06580 [Hansschlegelia plantiphila]